MTPYKTKPKRQDIAGEMNHEAIIIVTSRRELGLAMGYMTTQAENVLRPETYFTLNRNSFSEGPLQRTTLSSACESHALESE